MTYPGVRGWDCPARSSGDAGKLRQILINLLGNAVKFTEYGGVTLRAHWADGRATFDVEDSGPGIAPDDIEKIFEPFVQAEAGRQAKEGTGLGLALSRELAQLMGGNITAESEPGRGSHFRLVVSLPLASAALVQPEETRRVSRLVAGQPAWRILVVDDLTDNRVLLSGLLRSVGHEVKEAVSGEEALEIRRSFRPNFIWMDKRMPGIDGLETTRRIRAEEQGEGGPRAKIVALSASALQHERGEILASGCDDFVAKPFREGAIFAKIAEHLGARYEYGAPATAEPAPELITPPCLFAPGQVVLLVDDQPINRELARELLAQAGLNLTKAESGSTALTLLETHRFDAVLMDVQMPGMDGLEAVRAIRGQERLLHLPVIAATANALPGDRERFLAAGMSDYLAKPIEDDELRRVLTRWLRVVPGRLFEPIVYARNSCTDLVVRFSPSLESTT